MDNFPYSNEELNFTKILPFDREQFLRDTIKRLLEPQLNQLGCNLGQFLNFPNEEETREQLRKAVQSFMDNLVQRGLIEEHKQHVQVTVTIDPEDSYKANITFTPLDEIGVRIIEEMHNVDETNDNIC